MSRSKGTIGWCYYVYAPAISKLLRSSFLTVPKYQIKIVKYNKFDLYEIEFRRYFPISFKKSCV